MPTFRYGQTVIVSAMVDPNGRNPKDRPAVVVTRSDRIVEGQPLQVVAITTLLPGPVPVDCVKLPWDRRGHPRTGLKTDCAALCSWMVRVDPERLRSLGHVPGKYLKQIAEKLAALYGDEGPGDDQS